MKQQQLHAKRKRGEEGVPRTVDQCLQSAVNGEKQVHGGDGMSLH